MKVPLSLVCDICRRTFLHWHPVNQYGIKSAERERGIARALRGIFEGIWHRTSPGQSGSGQDPEEQLEVQAGWRSSATQSTFPTLEQSQTEHEVQREKSVPHLPLTQMEKMP